MIRYLSVLISVCFGCFFISCASQIEPSIFESQLQNTQESISSARKAQAEEYAQRELNKAIQLLNEAQEAQEAGKDETSWELMFQSELEAKIAKAKAREAIAEERVKKAKSAQTRVLLKKMEYKMKAAEAQQKLAEYQARLAEEEARRYQQIANEAKQNANRSIREAEKNMLKNKALLAIKEAEVLLQSTSDFEAEEYAPNEYKNASELIAEAKRLVDKEEYDEAESKAEEAESFASMAITGAKTARTAIKKRQTQTYIDTKVAIDRVRLIFDTARRYNAAEYASEEFSKAQMLLEQADRALKQRRFEQALSFSAQAKIHAIEARQIAQVKEQQRIERESREEMIARTKDAIFKAEEAVNRANPEIAEIVSELYNKAKDALKEAKDAMEEKDYQLALSSAKKSLTYMTDAKQKTETVLEVENKIIQATQKISKVQLDKTKRGILIRFSGDIFASGSSNLNQNYYPKLKVLADILKQYPQYNVLIEGHTDSIGNSEANLKLSNSRAYNFFKHLVEQHGISEKRVNPVGYGESQPIASNRTREGRERNRRIDVVILTRQ